MKVRICPDLETLSREAADIFLTISERSIAARGRFVVALSGGSTPRKLYSILASEPCKHKIHWEAIHFFWADERFVPHSDRDSNYRLLYDSLLRRVPVAASHVHPVRTSLPGPSLSAKEYEKEIIRFFCLPRIGLPKFDLVMLGIGEDGHTASLFPGSRILEEKSRLAGFRPGTGQRHSRITLTLPVINNARNIVFLVSGARKAHIAKEIIEGKAPRLPASRVVPRRGTLLFLLDRDAAGILTNGRAGSCGCNSSRSLKKPGTHC